MPRVFLTGATGFVGRHVLRALLGRGFSVRCLVRPGSEADLKGFDAIDRVPGNVLQPDDLPASAEGCAALVHLVGIIREQPSRGVTFERLHADATANMLRVAKAAGIRRYVHMSALGSRPGATSRYHQTKWKAEEVVRTSGLEWTIFRPSIIFGRGDEFISVLARMVRRLPVVPILGSGAYRLQPVSVEHVAQGFARAAGDPGTAGKIYEVGGPRPYSFVELLDLIGAAFGRRRVRKIHVPLAPVKIATRALHRLPFYPVTPDQLIMLEEESVTDPSPFYADFGLEPEPLPEGLRRMAAAR
jgi:uncharacterized protein YbjT (DUF2867 family)